LDFVLKNILMGLVSDIQIYVIFLFFYLGADFPFNIGLYDIVSLLVGFYATYTGYFIKPIYIN
jgi:hypothetical protein